MEDFNSSSLDASSLIKVEWSYFDIALLEIILSPLKTLISFESFIWKVSDGNNNLKVIYKKKYTKLIIITGYKLETF